MSDQLPLSRPRVRYRGVPGTVVTSWPPLDGYRPAESLVQFDGPHEWASEYSMASVAGTRIIVETDECEVLA